MTRQLNLTLLITLLVLSAGCSVLKPTARKAPPASASAATMALLERMPTESAAESNKNAAELLKLGSAQIEAVCAMVNPGAADDSKAQFALGAAVVYACRPGAETDRELLAAACIHALRRASTTEAKTFMIRQLERIGRDVAVAPLRDCLEDEHLRAPAVRALVVIYSPKAQNALLRALSAAKTNAARIDLIQALGELRVRAASGRMLKFLNAATDPTVRLEACWALANLGDPRAEALLKHCAFAPASTDPAKYASFYLLYARRLAEAGKAEKCAQICREIITAKALYAPNAVNYRSAALATLTEALDDKAAPDLLAAMASDAPALRAAALRLALKMSGTQMTSQWGNKMLDAQSPAAVRAEIARMLGERGDRVAAPAIITVLKDSDPAVRLAAIDAAGKLRSPGTLGALVERLAGATDPAEMAAIKSVLMQAPGNDYQPALAAAFKSASPAGRVAILELLAQRQAREFAAVAFAGAANDDPAVRVAALKSLRDLAGEQDLPRVMSLILEAQSGAEQNAARNAATGILARCKDHEAAANQLARAYDKAAAARKPTLLGLLPNLGGEGALKQVRQEAASGQPAIREAAIRAMAEWPEPAPMAELLALSKSGATPTLRIVAYRGYVRMIGLQKELSAAQKVELCQKALAAAPRREEAKPLLATLGTVATPEAFRAAAACLDDPALSEEAALAAVTIAGKLKGGSPAEVAAAMKRIQASKVSAATRTKARRVLAGAGK